MLDHIGLWQGSALRFVADALAADRRSVAGTTA